MVDASAMTQDGKPPGDPTDSALPTPQQESAQSEAGPPEVGQPEVAPPEVAPPEVAPPEVAPPEVAPESSPIAELSGSAGDVPAPTDRPPLSYDGTVASGSDSPGPSPATTSPAGAVPPVAPPPFTPEAWGQAARATVLFVLLGMALTAAVRFGLGDAWLYDFLKKNQLPMSERMTLIFQMVGVGGVLGLACIARILFSQRGPSDAALWERWAWFLSPLILTPAIAVVMEHQVWKGRHDDFLPVILFGGILAEFFFLRSYDAVPPSVSRLLRRWFDDEPPHGDALPNADKAPFWDRALSFVERHGALLTVVAAALAYGAFMSFYSIRWHHKLGTATFDLGINNNLLYGGLHGKFNQSPVIFPEDPQKYIANHLKIGLYTFLPIYALYPKAETLMALQSVSLGLGAIPLFLFARKRLPEWWAAAISLCYLAYYPMHGANFYEMKLVPTAAAIVLLCIWAIDDKRYVLGGIAFVWALIMREDIPVPLVVVGATFLLSGHRPVAGALIAGTATAWFILIRFRLMNEVGAWWFPNMYQDLWAEPERGFQSVIKTLFSNPAFTLKHVFTEKKFWYLMHLLVPLLFLPMRRWYGWAALVPGAILTLLVTDYAPPTLFSFQYVMHWSPYLFVAAVVVLGDIFGAPGGRTRSLAALTATCLVSAALSYNYGAFTRRDGALKAGYHKIDFGFSKQEAETYAQVRKLVASIPASASVGSTEHIGAHLSSRVGFYTLRRGAHGVEYIVACKSELKLDRTKQTVSEAVLSGEYGVVGRYGEYVVFQRGADTKDNPQIITEWKLVSSVNSRAKRYKRSETNDDAQAEHDEQHDEHGEDDEHGKDDEQHDDQDLPESDPAGDSGDPPLPPRLRPSPLPGPSKDRPGGSPPGQDPGRRQ